MRQQLTALLLSACAGSVSAQVYFPADGIWQFPQSNGSGLTLDFRDGTLGIGLYTYDVTGKPVWYSGAGTLVDGVVDTTVARFAQSDDGVVTQVGDARVVRIEFKTIAHATLTLDDSEPLPVQHLGFGTATIDGLDLVGESERLTRSIPDMRGRWLFTERADDMPITLDITFSRVEIRGYNNLYFESEPVSGWLRPERTYFLSCSPPPNGFLTCTLSYAPLSPPEWPQLAQFDPATLTPTRIQSDGQIGGTNWTGFRVPDTANAPVSGIWKIEGGTGQGLTIDVRPDLTAVGVYGYDDTGAATWSVATGALEDNVLAADLTTFTGGSCLTCEHENPTSDKVTPMTLEFTSSTRAMLTIGDAEPRAVSLLAFGAEYLNAPLTGDADVDTYGPHLLPAFEGTWARTDIITGINQGAGQSLRTSAMQFTVSEVDTLGLGDRMSYLMARALPSLQESEESFGHPIGTIVLCGDKTITQEIPGCQLLTDNTGPSPPPPPYPIASMSPIDITATRMSGVGTVAGEPVYIFRVPPKPAAATPAPTR